MKNKYTLMNEMVLKYDGQSHQIDANTLINSLINISAVIQEINTELFPGTTIDIKIKATQPGSFEVVTGLEVITKVAKSLFDSGTIDFAKEILATFRELLDLRHLLKGEEPDMVENKGNLVVIKKNDGAITIQKNTYNFYTKNDIANEAITKNFETLLNDTAIENFQIQNDTTKFTVYKDEFVNIAKKPYKKKENQNYIIDQDAVLSIVKVVFESRYKWDFYYKGNKISATIEDKDFYQQIDKGMSFAKGDIFKAELQIERVYDNSVNTYVNSGYAITKIAEHMPKSKQINLID